MTIAQHFRLLILLFLPACGLVQAQTACTFSLDHSTASFPAAGGNDQIQIGATPSGCSSTRTVTSNVTWITISFGNTGTGSGSTGYTVTPNNFLTARSGTITVAGLTFTVTQAAGTCSFTAAGGTTVNVPAAGGSGSFSFTSSNTQCSWTATGGADWLTFTPGSGTGGSIAFTAAANSGTSSRSATITVGNLTFTVSQSGACSVTLSPQSLTAPAGGISGTFSVTVSGSGSCPWTAVSNNPNFITVSGTVSGTASGTVSYTIAPNTTGVDRIGSITVNSTGFSVLQPSNCGYGISPVSASLPVTGGTGTFNLTAACPWTAVSSAPDWLIAQPASGTGNQTVTYVASPNSSVIPRLGTITIGTASFSVHMAGVPCSVTVNPSTVSLPVGGGSFAISVAASDGCSWAAATTSKWLTLSGASGSGAGSVSVTADSNPDPTVRTGSITIADQVITVTEDARQCDYSLSPTAAAFGSSGGSGIVSVATVCSWTAVSNAPWLVVQTGSGKGNGDIHYSLGRLPTSDPRTGTITIGTQTFTVTQTSSACSLTLSSPSIEVTPKEGRGVLRVTGNSDCHWQPSIDDDGSGWLTISSWANVNGGGVVLFRYEENDSVSPRQGTIRINSAGLDPLTSVVVQDAAVPVVTDVWNAASRQPGSATVSAGEIVAIRGQGLGPAAAVTQQVSDDGTTVLNTLAGIQVLFDGNPAALLRVSNEEVQAVVPYEIDGQQTTQMTVLNQGVVSNAMTLNVASATPGVFTLDDSGKGQIDARNPDGSPNSASNAVARGSNITFFITGVGQTNPAGADGLLNTRPAPVPVLPVTVQIGGQNANPLTVAGSLTEVAGKIQVVARVVQQVQPGAAVPVIVKVGTAQTQASITIAVK